MSNTKNDVIIISVSDLDMNRKFFSALGFELIDMTASQFMAKLNGKIIGVVLQGEGRVDDIRSSKPMRTAHTKPLGRGIELWFSVDDVREHYDHSLESQVDIIVPFGNRGYGSVGDYGTRSPDGFLFFFSQPQSKRSKE